jgi:ABC-2 type transport system ATP-binding protein
VLEVDGLSFSYGSRQVLTDVDLALGVGANVLLGRNGAGKTTLLRMLAGAAHPAAGAIGLDGEPVDVRRRGGRRVLRRVGWLPQTFGYPPRMRTVEFVAYAAWLKQVPRAVLGSRVDTALAAAAVTEQAGRPLRELSGGQLRRAGLAASVVADPRLLILDEPTAGLDPEQRGSFHELVRGAARDKVVVIATHLLEDVAALAEWVVVIDAGAVRWQGTAAQLAGAGDGAEAGPVDTERLRQGLRTVLGAQ